MVHQVKYLHVKSTRTDQSKLATLFFFFFKQEATHETSNEEAAAKNFFSSVHVIGTAWFDECFPLYVITGRHYFL